MNFYYGIAKHVVISIKFLKKFRPDPASTITLSQRGINVGLTSPQRCDKTLYKRYFVNSQKRTNNGGLLRSEQRSHHVHTTLLSGQIATLAG